MRIIQLTQGATAFVSDEDYDRLSHYKWKLLKDGDRRYAIREENGRLIAMHQDVLGAKDGLLIDHRDRNGLNNVRSNLRYATRSQNQVNSVRPKPATASSQFKGVTMIPARWVARIKVNGKSQHLGTFYSEAEAAEAYAAAARRLYPDFAPVTRPA